MIEQPPPCSDQPPLHLFDTLVYDGHNFKVWEDAGTFSQQKFENLNFTDNLNRSVGCLLRKVNGSFELVATAFVVRYQPPPSNLLVGNDRVQALLLTAAHVYSSPLSSRDLTGDFFFTLSPSLDDDILSTYSKFRVQRLLAFDPSTEDSQIDPLLNYECMVSQDVELLAVIEGDRSHELAAYGNDFFSLKHRDLSKMNQLVAGKACVIVGYTARLANDDVELWAPITAKQKKELKGVAEQVVDSRLGDPIRVFSRGEIILANETCVAVNCSTWKGMSGSPICIISEDGARLDYCGVYNGAAALPFQALTSKILFHLQGKKFRFTQDDIPKIPVLTQAQLQYQRPEHCARYQLRSELLWAEILRKLLWILLDKHNGLKKLITNLNRPLREFLGDAEGFGINVEHNLGVCGGDRFSSITDCIDRSKNTPDAPIVDKFVEFTGLTRLGASALLTESQRNNSLERFLNDGVKGKKKKCMIFTEDAKKLSRDLVEELEQFVNKFENNITLVAERKAHKEFVKMWSRFSKIFEIWRTTLND